MRYFAPEARAWGTARAVEASRAREMAFIVLLMGSVLSGVAVGGRRAIYLYEENG